MAILDKLLQRMASQLPENRPDCDEILATTNTWTLNEIHLIDDDIKHEFNILRNNFQFSDSLETYVKYHLNL